MKVKISKKIIFISLIVISIIVILLTSYFLLSKHQIIRWQTGSSKYDYLESFCDLEETNSSKKISCRGFIVNEALSNNRIKCLNILLYTGTEELQEIEICEKDFVVEWSNPYGDYDKYVPVNLEIQMSKNLFSSYKSDQIKITLMNDVDVFEILVRLPHEQDAERSMRNLVYIREYQDIEDAGYYLTRHRESEVDDILVLDSMRIKNLSVKDDEVVLLTETTLYGTNLVIEIRAEEFSYIEKEMYESKEIYIDSNNSYAFDKQEDFKAVFEFNPDILNVDTYMESLKNGGESKILLTTELKLISVIKEQYGE
jgi:hypothetical protein